MYPDHTECRLSSSDLDLCILTMWRIFRDSLALLSPLVPGVLHSQPSLGQPEAPFVVEHDGPLSHGGVWTEAFQLASDAVSKMTTEEKASPHRPSVNWKLIGIRRSI